MASGVMPQRKAAAPDEETEASLDRAGTQANPGHRQQWLAEILGVDDKTVPAARKRLEATFGNSELKKLRGKDGRSGPQDYGQVIANTPGELRVARESSAVCPLPAMEN